MKTALRSLGILFTIGWLVFMGYAAQAQVDFTSCYSFTGGNNGSGGVNTSVPSIAYGLHGSSYALVQFRDSIRIGSVLRRVMTAPGSHALLVCFDSLKQVAWTRLISPLTDNGTVITMDIDGLGNVWLAGLCGSSYLPSSVPITFEGQTSPAANPLVVNTWVASYSATGAFRWATVMPSTFNAAPPMLATTVAGKRIRGV